MNWDVLKGEVTRMKYDALYDAQDYQGIADELNDRKKIDNPDAQGVVARSVTLADMLAVVDVTEYAKLVALPDWLMNRVDNNATCQAILAAQLPKSKSALVALLEETVPDPNWTAKVPGQSRANALGLGTVKAAHVQKVLA